VYDACKRYYLTWIAPEGYKPGTKKRDDEIVKRYAAFQLAVKSGTATVKVMRLSEWYEIWMQDYVKPNCSARTHYEWGILWKRIGPQLGHLRTDKIAPSDVDKFYKWLSTVVIDKDTGKTLSASTVRHYHVILHAMFRDAVKKGLAARNPCSVERLTAPPQAPQVEAECLESEQVVRLIAALEKEPIIFRCMLLLCLETGMRKSELHGLQWRDYKPDTGILWVKRTLQYLGDGQGVRIQDTKTAKSVRPIALSDGMMALMEEWRTEQNKWREAVGRAWNTQQSPGTKKGDANRPGQPSTGFRKGDILPGDWMFTDGYGNPRYSGSFLPRFKKFLSRAGFTPDEVKALKIHSLRHTSASLLIADGTDIRTVAARLGHSQTSTTLNIYAHAVAEANALAAKGLGNRLFGAQAEAPVSADKLPLT